MLNEIFLGRLVLGNLPYRILGAWARYSIQYGTRIRTRGDA
jgi:hypothetical protein